MTLVNSKHSDHFDSADNGDGNTAKSRTGWRPHTSLPEYSGPFRCAGRCKDGTRCGQRGGHERHGVRLCFQHISQSPPFEYRDTIAEQKAKIAAARARLDPGPLS